jgi:4-amino-4-deoxy-L-arabinose transferase-like glycosyltransferase
MERAPARSAGFAQLARRLARGREEDAAWIRPSLLTILVLTAALYVWGLDRNGFANTYYSAAVQAATQSWKAFFFGSLDAGNFITVDKPPAALWLIGLSARLFGLSAWSLLLPEAAAGVLTVAVLFQIVRSSFGAVAALVAAVVMALTPVAVVMFRFNNPDALLTLLLVASAWALLKALVSGRTGWLLLSAAFVGLAFNTKYLQAYIVLPALVLTYFLLGPGSLRRRFLQLLGAGAVLVVASGWWMAIVTAIPAAQRPFIGGSTNNSVLDLVLGYDGFGRILGMQRPGGAGPSAVPGGGGGGFGGQPGWLRLFNEQVGGEVSWLLPLAGVGLLAGLWARRTRPRADVARAAYVLWGLWLLVHAVVFSFASGIFHAYYTVAMAPAIAALVGGGLVELWRLRSRSVLGAAALGFGLVLTAWWGSRLLARTPGFAPGLGTLELGAAVAAALLLLALGFWRRASAGIGRRLPMVAVVVGSAALLLGPAAYAVDTLAQSRNGPDPAPGPMASARGAGGPGGLGDGGAVRLAGQGGPPPGMLATAPGPAGGPAQVVGRGPGAGGRGGAAADPALISYLKQHQGGATWIVAVTSAGESASIQLASGRPVMAMGGFMGSDPALNVDQLKAIISSGKLRYLLLAGQGLDARGGPAGDGSGQARTAWVTQNCAKVSYTGSSTSSQSGTLYDCSAAAGAGG